jgi:hypothetical protein
VLIKLATPTVNKIGTKIEHKTLLVK